jgi:hypothetical protein
MHGVERVVCHPLGGLELIRIVRVAFHCSRARCNARIACWSSFFTATGLMKGERNTSSTASHSTRSVLFRCR